MKVKTLISLLVLLFVAEIGLYAQKVVRVAAFNYYPAIFRDTDGHVKGFFVDALNELGQRENIRFEYIYGTWNEAINRLKKEEVDMMTSVGYTPERSVFMDYTNTPLLTVWGEVYLRPSSDIDGILNLDGKTIAIMKEDINGNHLVELTKKLSIQCKFVVVNDFEEVFLLISSGKVDAGVVNNTFGAAKYKEYGLRSSGIIFNPFNIYFTVKKGKNLALLTLLDKYLKKWKYDQNSTYNEARQKWSHNKIGSIEIFPEWLKRAIYLTIILLIVLVSFIAILRYQVRKATMRVKKSELRFKLFMGNTPAYVYIKDQSLNHTYRNKLVNQLVGSNDEDFFSSSRTIFDIKTANLLEEADMKILNFEENEINLTYPCVINGEKKWLHDYKFILDIPGEEPAVGGVAFDITNLKETEFELNIARIRAEESDNLKTAFLQNISHEIRTPLNAIVGFAGILNKPNLSEEKKRGFISIIQNSSKQLLSIVSDILTISALETKQETLNLEVFSLNELLNNLEEMFAPQATEKGLAIHTVKKLDDNQSFINSDKTKITQILTNLLSNALKFTDTGFIEIGYCLQKEYLEFYVKDTGIGIGNDKHEKIFERFNQGEQSIANTYGGTGLGLSISKGFTELLGGKIWLESEAEKGATFYFTVPYISDTYSANLSDNQIQIKNNSTILVAEDIEVNFKLIEQILSVYNVELIWARNGEEAVEICKLDKEIDLLLMDIKMPVLDGYSAAKQIKQIRNNLPIIAQTAYALDSERKKYTEPVFDDYITKPLQMDDLVQKVAGFIHP